MNNTPNEIIKQYNQSQNYKASLGARGLFEQSKMNARFYSGDQWYGTAFKADRPLVRHNLVKRIGEYKMGVLTSEEREVDFTAEGFCSLKEDRDILLSSESIKEFKRSSKASDITKEQEVALLCEAMNKYYKFWSRKTRLEEKLALLLKDSFISGTGILYTFWQNESDLGADIDCEVLAVENVAFGDNTLDDLQKQPYIIVKTERETNELKKVALLFGADKNQVQNIKPDHSFNDKTSVYTKFFKEKDIMGRVLVKAVTVTEKAVIRPVFDTKLSRYPLSIFTWEARKNSIIGDSEITHILPNQIAINRLITAQVWAAMSMGMPIMTVNGDTVSGEITNDPGQIIKVYGSNEDVAGAVHYVTPPDFSENFERAISSLINNTLEASGSMGALYSNMTYNNTAAINALIKNSDISIKILKTRYINFLCETALVWLDLCLNYYKEKRLRIEDQSGIWYYDFNCAKYSDIKFVVDIKELSQEGERKSDS